MSWTPRSLEINQQTGRVGMDGGFWTKKKSGFAIQQSFNIRKKDCQKTLKK